MTTKGLSAILQLSWHSYQQVLCPMCKNEERRKIYPLFLLLLKGALLNIIIIVMLYLLHGIWNIAFVLGKKIKILREPLASDSNMRGQQWFNQVWWLEERMVLTLNIFYIIYTVKLIYLFSKMISYWFFRLIWIAFINIWKQIKNTTKIKTNKSNNRKPCFLTCQYCLIFSYWQSNRHLVVLE